MQPRLILKDGSEYQLDEQLYSELAKVYFDVDRQLAKMRLWCMVNPEKRKTRRGIKRFIVAWFNRARPSLLRPHCKPILEVGQAELKPLSPEQRDLNQRRLQDLKKLVGVSRTSIEFP
jgi:hypothetical protein